MRVLEKQLLSLRSKNDLRESLSFLRHAIKEDQGAREELLSDRDAADALIPALSSEDAKARKQAALLIGEAGLSADHGFRQALLDAYRSESTLFVRESYLKALAMAGEVSSDEKQLYRERLDQIDGESFPDTDMKHLLAERKALVALLGEERAERPVYTQPSGYTALFVPVPGFSEVMKRAFFDRGITDGYSKLGALVRPSQIGAVKDVRVYDHIRYLIPEDYTLLPEKTGEEASSEGIKAFFGKAYQGQVSVRVFVHEKGDGRQKKAKCFAGELLRSSHGAMVSEAPYDAEIHFHRKRTGGYLLFVRPLEGDTRFSYAKNLLSTSMQPAKAAVMVSLLDEYISSYAKVADLFAGNGTLLLERDAALRTKAMFALDTSEEAVTAGKANATDRGRKVIFIRRSAFTFVTKEPFDEIISELPDLYGKSAPERQSFFEKLGHVTAQILRDGGRAFYLTSCGNEIKAMARKSDGLLFLSEISFDDGRSIYILEKKV